MIDYILVVAVGISAGRRRAGLRRAAASSRTRLPICLGILAMITLVNLRGVREAGIFFMVPTYLFVGTLLTAIVIGMFKTVLAGGHPVPVVAPPPPPALPPSPSRACGCCCRFSRTAARP